MRIATIEVPYGTFRVAIISDVEGGRMTCFNPDCEGAWEFHADEWKDVSSDHVSVHPSVSSILRYFTFNHLPPRLRTISERFAATAAYVALNLTGAEATVALRKLLEAKDCAVRAALE